MQRRRFLIRSGGLGAAGISLQLGVGPTMAAPGDSAWAIDVSDHIEGHPTIVDGTVYVGVTREGTDPEGIYAYDATSGEREWSRETQNGVRTTPTVVDGIVYVTDSGYVRAFDADDGERRWETSINPGGRAEASPTVADDRVYVGSFGDGHAVTALDSQTGDELWSTSMQGEVSTPVATRELVFVSQDPRGAGDENGVYALDAETGETEWFHQTEGEVRSPVTVADGRVLVKDLDYLYALDALSGDRQWRADDGGLRMPTVFNGTVYTASDKAYAFDLNGNRKWTFEQSGILTPPTVAGETVYYATLDDGLYAVDAGDGRQRWVADLSTERPTGITVADGLIYVTGSDGSLEAIETDHSKSSEDSRVRLGTLGHTSSWTGESIELGGDSTQTEPDEERAEEPDATEEDVSDDEEVATGSGGSDGDDSSDEEGGDTSETTDGDESSNTAEETDTTEESADENDESDASGPGFGIGTGIVGLGGGLYVIKQRLEDDPDE